MYKYSELFPETENMIKLKFNFYLLQLYSPLKYEQFLVILLLILISIFNLMDNVSKVRKSGTLVNNFFTCV